jgi:hypothetical protein
VHHGVVAGTGDKVRAEILGGPQRYPSQRCGYMVGGGWSGGLIGDRLAVVGADTARAREGLQKAAAGTE